jgi:ABC-type glycerol-3-phosphate transport system substrate-binding protein
MNSIYNYKYKTYALLLSFPLVLTGCSPKNLPIIGKYFGGSAPVAKEVSLTVWGLWETEQTLQPLLQKYSAEHPNIKITYEDRSIMPLVDYKERVFTRAFEGTKPDIVLAHASWIPRLVAGGGAWAVPAGVFETGYLDNNFFPVAKSSGVIGGSLYSLPSTYDGLVLVYNKRHFEGAGITKPPVDWEEFRRDAISLTVRDGAGLVRAGAAMGLADNIEHFSDVLGLMWLQAGVKIPEELDTEQAKDALTFYTNFTKEDGVWNASMPESVRAFAGEKVSMILVPTWRIYELLSNMQDSAVVGVAPVPQALQDTPVTWATYWTWVVPKSSPSPNESWDVIKYITDAEQQTALFSEATKTRPFGSIYSNVTLAQNLSTNGYLKAAIETAPYAQTAEIAGRSGNRRQYDALKQAVNDVASGKSVGESLSTAKTAISQ